MLPLLVRSPFAPYVQGNSHVQHSTSRFQPRSLVSSTVITLSSIESIKSQHRNYGFADRGNKARGKLRTDYEYLVGCLTWEGKKERAKIIVRKALEIVKDKTKEDPHKILSMAMGALKPIMLLTSRKTGATVTKIPTLVKKEKDRSLAFRWLVAATKDRKEKGFAERLALEIVETVQGKSTALKKKEELYRVAVQNRVYLSEGSYEDKGPETQHDRDKRLWQDVDMEKPFTFMHLPEEDIDENDIELEHPEQEVEPVMFWSEELENAENEEYIEGETHELSRDQAAPKEKGQEEQEAGEEEGEDEDEVEPVFNTTAKLYKERAKRAHKGIPKRQAVERAKAALRGDKKKNNKRSTQTAASTAPANNNTTNTKTPPTTNSKRTNTAKST